MPEKNDERIGRQQESKPPGSDSSKADVMMDFQEVSLFFKIRMPLLKGAFSVIGLSDIGKFSWEAFILFSFAYR
jgi:hypothetical protein